MTSPNPYAIDADTLSGMKPLRQAVFAFRSGAGEREANLQGAINALVGTPDVFVVEVSPVYETGAADLGGSSSASVPSLSAVVLTDTTLSEDRLLDRIVTIESVYRRERDGQDAAYALDIDLLVVGDTVRTDADVVLPHPTTHQRAEVLQAWSDIDSAANIPGRGAVVEVLAALGSDGIRCRADVELER